MLHFIWTTLANGISDASLTTGSSETNQLANTHILAPSFLRSALPTEFDLSREFPECFRKLTQGAKCSNCYVFASKVAIEAQACIKHVQAFGEPWLTSISAQQIMNCSNKENVNEAGFDSELIDQYWVGDGCNGGNLLTVNMLPHEIGWEGHFCKEDPNNIYSGTDISICKADCHLEMGLYLDKDENQEDGYFEALLSTAEVKEAIMAGSPVLTHFREVDDLLVDAGVFSDANGSCDNEAGESHVAAVVGWGSEEGKEFWKVNVTWGHRPSVDVDNFLKIAIDDNGLEYGPDNPGICGFNMSLRQFSVMLNAPNGSLNTTTTTTTNWAPIQRSGVCQDKSDRCSDLISDTSKFPFCQFDWVDEIELVFYSLLCPETCAQRSIEMAEQHGALNYLFQYTCEDWECEHYDCAKDYHLGDEGGQGSYPYAASAGAMVGACSWLFVWFSSLMFM